MTTATLENRSRLYHNCYRYAIGIAYSGARFLGYLDSEYVTNQHRTASVMGWNRPEDPVEHVLDVADHLRGLGPNIKLITSWFTMFVYTNDAADHARICNFPHVRVTSYRQAELTLPPGVLLRRNPKYLYRSYFRERRVDGTQGQEFLQFVISRGDYFNLDESTRMRLGSGRHRYPFARHSYIEHNSPLDPTIIELVMPGAIRQTLPIQAK
jgi:hypothetical protein